MTNKKTSSLWFIGGFVAVVLAGIAKIAIANHFSDDIED
jgi:hypothetical protein